MPFVLTRDEYLRKRSEGMSKSGIAREQGVKAPTLSYWLEKWGLKDSAMEKAEIQHIVCVDQSPAPKPLIEQTSNSTTPNIVNSNDMPSPDEEKSSVEGMRSKLASNTSEQVNTSVTESHNTLVINDESTTFKQANYVTIRVPISKVNVPSVISTEGMTRSELLNTAFVLAQSAVASAYEDLVDLVGDNVSTEQVQKYVERKLASSSRVSLTG